jgi:uncharacterized protein (TIGR03437 family)
MRSLILLCLGASICPAQTTSLPPMLFGAGFSNPFPLSVAPGQLLTLFVQPGAGYDPSAPLPTVSATFWNGTSEEAMPVLQTVQATTACSFPSSPVVCTNVLAVTVQIPLDVPISTGIVVMPPGAAAVSVNGVETPYVAAQAWPDHVHILTGCDVIVAPSSSANLLQVPCAPMITHADGTLVSVNSPAVAGEELVAYATGLGQTNPPLTTGRPASASSPTVSTFNLDFNYRPNALATSPPPHCCDCAIHQRDQRLYRALSNQFHRAGASRRIAAVQPVRNRLRHHQGPVLQPDRQRRFVLFVRWRGHLRPTRRQFLI